MRAAEGPDRALRACIYARVSTEDQAEHGTSLIGQVERCRSYAKCQSWDVVDEFVDEGISGAASSRPALDKLLAAVRDGLVEAIVVAKLDRLGRSMRNLSALLGELDDRGIRLVSVAEAFDSATASGRLQRNILGSFAEFEREQIRERTSSGVASVARQGFWPGGPPPFGWSVVADAHQPHRSRLVINEVEAAALRVAVDGIVIERLSTGEVAARLNDLGIPPRKATGWQRHMVRHLLLNLPLSGEWLWRRGRDGSGRRRQADGPPITVAVPAVIDRALHDELLAVLSDRSTGPRSAMRQRVYLLSRRITSPHGAPMFGFPRPNGDRRYVCRDALASGKEDRCPCRRVDADTVEVQVWNEVVALLSEPQRLIALAEAALGLRGSERTAEDEQIDAVDARIRRLEEALSDDLADLVLRGVDGAAVRRATAKVDAELAQLRRRRTKLSAWQAANQVTAERSRHLRDLADVGTQTLHSADGAIKRRLIDILDVRVHVDGWELCETCRGKGLLPASGSEERDGLGRTGRVCPTCRRSRWLPRIGVRGVFPMGASGGRLPSDLPFEVAMPRLRALG